MAYRVVLLRLAARDLDDAYLRARENAPAAAGRWLSRFRDALATLANNPERCPLAHENGKVAITLREYHFGKRANVFRAIFAVTADRVTVLRIVRAQRGFLSRKQLEEAADQGGEQQSEEL